MPRQSDDLHLYGTADPDNRQTPGPEGLRGERTDAAETARPELRHAIDGPDGPLVLEAQSGVVYAETLGVGAKPLPETGVQDTAGTDAIPGTAARPSILPLLIAAAVAGTVILLLRRSRIRRNPARVEPPAIPPNCVAPVAFAPDSTEPENFTQTRDVGPSHMRDPDAARGWDLVDEGSDGSFPASDPPAYTHG